MTGSRQREVLLQDMQVVDVRNNEDGKGAVIRVQIPRYVLKRKAEL